MNPTNWLWEITVVDNLGQEKQVFVTATSLSRVLDDLDTVPKEEGEITGVVRRVPIMKDMGDGICGAKC